LEGNLSWRRSGPVAWAQQVRPAIERVLAQAVREPGQVTVTPDCLAAGSDTRGCVLLADGRVFLLPAQGGGQAWVLDPETGAVHGVQWPGSAAEDFAGGCLLWDGRVFVAPGPENTVGQAYLYGPALDRVMKAGPAVATTCGGSALLADGRVLLAPLTAATPACVLDPVTLAAVTVPLPPGDANWRGGCCCRMAVPCCCPSTARPPLYWSMTPQPLRWRPCPRWPS
jgi:hypothetical protein